MRFVLPVEGGVIRNDPAGRGFFKARRKVGRKNRVHKGVDLACDVGELVLAPISGVVTKLGYPYGDDLSYRYVEITAPGGLRSRVFYVDPTIKTGASVLAGDEIGFAQDVTQRYKVDAAGGVRYRTHKMTPHVHVELICGEPHIAAKTVEKVVYLDLGLFFPLE